MDALADLADEWRLTLQTVSEQTKIVYTRSVRQFREYLATEHPDVTGPEQVARRHVDGWLGHLADEGRSEGTRRVRLIAVRLFFAYLLGEDNIPVTVNPADRVSLPTPKEHVVPIIPDADLSALLAVCAGSTFVDLRDQAMLRVLIDTGCRRAELAGLDMADVDLRAQDLTLRATKGGHARQVPVGSRTALALRKYVRARARRPAAASPALFLAIRSDAAGSWRISGGGIARMLNRRCVLAGLPEFYPHQFRHTWAHDQLANGANEVDVEKLAGWRSPMMVRRYGNSAAAQRARDSARKLARGDRV